MRNLSAADELLSFLSCRGALIVRIILTASHVYRYNSNPKLPPSVLSVIWTELLNFKMLSKLYAYLLPLPPWLSLSIAPAQLITSFSLSTGTASNHHYLIHRLPHPQDHVQAVRRVWQRRPRHVQVGRC
jgi:diadenosine tetraphosphatase ApaH/serine/threonine PP2A family protein phosphatase